MTEDMQLDRESLYLVHLLWTLFVFEVPLGTSGTYLFSRQSVSPSNIVSLPGVPLRQVQFVVI